MFMSILAWVEWWRHPSVKALVFEAYSRMSSLMLQMLPAQPEESQNAVYTHATLSWHEPILIATVACYNYCRALYYIVCGKIEGKYVYGSKNNKRQLKMMGKQKVLQEALQLDQDLLICNRTVETTISFSSIDDTTEIVPDLTQNLDDVEFTQYDYDDPIINKLIESNQLCPIYDEVKESKCRKQRNYKIS